MRRDVAYSVADYALPVTIDRRGHVAPFAQGAYVTCVGMGHLYDDLETAERPYPFPPERCVRMQEAGIGVVTGHAWHVPYLELMTSARLDQVYRARKKHHLINVTEDLYYYVAFRKGLFWARFDWIEEVTDTVLPGEEETCARRTGHVQ